MKVLLNRRYSGNHSKRFWDRVKKLKNESDHQAAYMFGVVLQELEERVLKFLEQTEQRHAERTAGTPLTS
jgi:hypothetical protein